MTGPIAKRSVGGISDQQEISALCPNQTRVEDVELRDQTRGRNLLSRTSHSNAVDDSHENSDR